jgi:carboxymethylenebutenolidase
MSSAVDHLAGQANVTGRGIGVIGFCMGGMLTWLLAVNRPDRVLAAVPFYGYPSGDMEPDWAPLSASVHAHMAERDQFFDPAGGTKLETKLRAMGKDVRVIVHPGTGHGFMAAHNTLGTYDPDLFERLWPQVVEFLHEKLG